MVLWSWSALAGQGHGVHDFGKDITENQACEAAKLKATKDLIENELGVYINIRDLMLCVNDNCELNSFKWIFYPAITKNLEFTTAITHIDGNRMCEASVDGDVKNLDTHYKDGHDFSITLSQHGIYHDNDNIEITVWGQTKQHYKIYIVNKEAKLLYPNKFHNEGKARQIVVPNSLYTLTVKKEINPNSLIIVISHTKHFDMLEKYHIKDFTEKLMDMKAKGFRLRMYDFIVK
tara:strand:- start:20148 stop:20846 length:699 start_codon:yes stop_codon:yes gene_type:complete